MKTINWKAVGAWAMGLLSPVVAEWVPDMMANKAPDIQPWHSLALMITGGFIVNMKRPADHNDDTTPAK